MKRPLVIALVLCATLLTTSAQAQSTGVRSNPSFQGAALPDNLVGNSSARTFSLLDPSRLHISQSYSMSFVSSSYGSETIGLYMTSLVYQISRPLTLSLDLGYMHRPSALLGGTNSSLDGRFLPNVRLDYRPSRNLHLSVDVRTVPAYGAGWWGANPYGYDRGMFDRDNDWRYTDPAPRTVGDSQ